ncbi:hypothetical protein [Pseudoxanthomonas sacheonensis]|uniref:Cytochrome c domain-containing protein n=1 Tax=Pseudoxanthomonas sacheonensis TaxID=443615 RepID=A0ABU1RMB0_9GAMM|nr:hypothetical protein [Pseudoxanthomonas sacheonensis]MDR6839913.1 hypothetical protein [Pseudoxanthomonas sacheonensis]
MGRNTVWIGLLGALMLGALSVTAKSSDASPPVWTSLEGMHADYVRAFVESDGFGKARITPMMRLMHSGRLTLDDKPLHVGDVQLIGIAKHDPPVVYASGFMAFQHADTDESFLPMRASRSVDGQERLILRTLEKEQEVVARTDASGLKAYGAIRATTACLECHRSKREGDLLGAFVYRLEPARE